MPLSEWLVHTFNYIIEKRDFPDLWSEGIRSAVFKSGPRNIVENYRGITILPILEKVFEAAVYKRLSFVNEAFNKIDPFNGGFLHGSRTADNLFIINGLIQRQLIIGQPLYICFVDFSKAFDLVNRNILFYKLIKSGWHGRVVDTLRSLYRKTQYRVKHKGYLSEPILDSTGVNQGGVASGLLFRKYMSDLILYLDAEVGICVEDMIISHLLWADDLVLLANGVAGLQKQLDGLLRFTSDNHAIVNAIKTKCMAFGNVTPFAVKFNGKVIEQVDRYKYVGNIARSTKRYDEDIFSENYAYLCDQARKALYSVRKRTSCLGNLPPKIMFHIFDTVVKPILTYGSDVWGANKTGLTAINKVFLRFVRCTLGVKATTCNIIVFGECGRMPPSIACKIAIMCYMNRLYHLPERSIVKKVYNVLENLHLQGFTTWITKVRELIHNYNLNVEMDKESFKRACKGAVSNKFIEDWNAELNDTQKNPLLRTYKQIKTEFTMEPYLDLVQNYRYRKAISSIRTSSHTLAVEYGRHHNIPLNMRLCHTCCMIEDEMHFITNCKINQVERDILYSNIIQVDQSFMDLHAIDKFVYVFSSRNPQILTWLGKFIHKSLSARNESQCGYP